MKAKVLVSPKGYDLEGKTFDVSVEYPTGVDLTIPKQSETGVDITLFFKYEDVEMVQEKEPLCDKCGESLKSNWASSLEVCGNCIDNDVLSNSAGRKPMYWQDPIQLIRDKKQKSKTQHLRCKIF